MYPFAIILFLISSIIPNELQDVTKMKNSFITGDTYNWGIICVQETFWDDTFMEIIL